MTKIQNNATLIEKPSLLCSETPSVRGTLSSVLASMHPEATRLTNQPDFREMGASTASRSFVQSNVYL